jgi:hypothetical protein
MFDALQIGIMGAKFVHENQKLQVIMQGAESYIETAFKNQMKVWG